MSDSPPLKRCKVLIVEDDDVSREVLGKLLSLHGCAIIAAATLREAAAKLDGQTHILLDLNLPDGPGGQLLRIVRDGYPATFVAVLTAERPDSPLLVDALSQHPDAVFEKPVELKRIIGWLDATPS